jgi:hypothetical protein
MASSSLGVVAGFFFFFNPGNKPFFLASTKLKFLNNNKDLVAFDKYDYEFFKEDS